MQVLPIRAFIAMLALVTLAGACAPQPSSTNSPASSAGQPQAQPAPRGPKILTIGSQRAPYDLHRDLGERETGVGGASTIFMLPHDLLVVEDDRGAWVPRLAAQQLSVDNGTWRINDDGTMVTTWKE